MILRNTDKKKAPHKSSYTIALYLYKYYFNISELQYETLRIIGPSTISVPHVQHFTRKKLHKIDTNVHEMAHC